MTAEDRCPGCAGSHIARALANEMIGQILDRMPDYVVDTERMMPFGNQGANAGYSSIPDLHPGPADGNNHARS
jgi:hypothetical protein